MRCHVAGQELENGHMGGGSSWVEFQQTAGGQFKMLRPQVVLLRWHDRPLMRPTAGAAFAGALLSIRMRVGRGEPLSEALQGRSNGRFITLSACNEG